MFQGVRIDSDQFACATRAISIAIFLEIPFGLPHVEAPGMLLWSSVAITLAAKKYYLYQRKIKASDSLHNYP